MLNLKPLRLKYGLDSKVKERQFARGMFGVVVPE